MNFAIKKNAQIFILQKTNKKRNFPKSLFFLSLNTLRIYHCFHYLDFYRNFVVQLTWLDSAVENTYEALSSKGK